MAAIEGVEAFVNRPNWQGLLVPFPQPACPNRSFRVPGFRYIGAGVRPASPPRRRRAGAVRLLRKGGGGPVRHVSALCVRRLLHLDRRGRSDVGHLPRVRSHERAVPQPRMGRTPPVHRRDLGRALRRRCLARVALGALKAAGCRATPLVGARATREPERVAKSRARRRLTERVRREAPAPTARRPR